MSGFLIRGVLVEYGSEFIGPIPNIVVFQFNPDRLSRTINIPAPAAEGARQREPAQAAAPPAESFTLTAHFSAADDLAGAGVVARAFGIGPQLAALEKMVYPASPLGGLLGQAIDAVGDALGLGDSAAPPERPIPREAVPRLLFIWGPSRVLPVRIKTLSITEQKFDAFLNPVQAEVQLGLDVVSFAPDSSDAIGQGAQAYTRTVKDVQAVLNLGKAIELTVSVVPF